MLALIDVDWYEDTCFAVLFGLFGILLVAAFLLLFDRCVDTFSLPVRLVRPTERELFLL